MQEKALGEMHENHRLVSFTSHKLPPKPLPFVPEMSIMPQEVGADAPLRLRRFWPPMDLFLLRSFVFCQYPGCVPEERSDGYAAIPKRHTAAPSGAGYVSILLRLGSAHGPPVSPHRPLCGTAHLPPAADAAVSVAAGCNPTGASVLPPVCPAVRACAQRLP